MVQSRGIVALFCDKGNIFPSLEKSCGEARPVVDEEIIDLLYLFPYRKKENTKLSLLI